MNLICHMRVLLAVCIPVMSFQLADVRASEELETDDFKVIAEKALELSDKYDAENVLVVLDVDNTLLATTQDLGSDQWFGWQNRLRTERPLPDAAVSANFPGLLRAYALVLSLSAQRPTQPDLPSIIEHLQKTGCKTLVLTSASFSSTVARRVP